MGIIIGCCGKGIPDIQQLGEQPDIAQSCGHGAGHFKALCGGGRTIIILDWKIVVKGKLIQ